jgi:hypothetical protein
MRSSRAGSSKEGNPMFSTLRISPHGPTPPEAPEDDRAEEEEE